MPTDISKRFFLIKNNKSGKEKWIGESEWAAHDVAAWSKIKACRLREHLDPMGFPAKLYRKEFVTAEGKETTDIKFYWEEDGGAVIDGCDMGPRVEEWFGDWDYEYSMKVKKNDIPKFLYLILKDSFNSSEPLTYGRLRKICAGNGIETKTFSWS
ncbi:MAG: hypothetical protein CMM32_09490 [Rhodospirillaceae bacterium]|nr:hypothetical protein [Rhodospirillaceae bacterium]